MVIFIRQTLNLDQARDSGTDFGKIHRNFNRILNLVARVSAEASLNPGETCEFPQDFQHIGGKCLLSDGYGPHTDDVAEKFGLVVVIEVFRYEVGSPV